ncbi:HAMP domain-containing sensor histidine kinase [Nonomuraea sp. NPDC050310]|uniref:sensor histidine kinase n=1 Tax=Nonomuraea sp. NPDC050310 TaxID=3154935 RepID=UPI0033DAF45A
MGLRGRIALALAGTAVLVAAAIGVLVHVHTSGSRLDAARTELDRHLVTLLERQLEGQDAGLHIGDPALPLPLAAVLAARPVRATYLEGDRLWAAARVGESVYSLSRSYRPELASQAALDRALVGSGLLATVAASLLGVAVANGLSRRLRTVARTAAAITAGDLSARVTPRLVGETAAKERAPGQAQRTAASRGEAADARWTEARTAGRPEVVAAGRGDGSAGQDEVAALGRALDGMADALQARLEAERRVTADIAHELRTPVAGLVAAAELLPPGRPTELVRDRAAVLRRLVEDVLEVARLDSATERPSLEPRLSATLARRALTSLHLGEGEPGSPRETAEATDTEPSVLPEAAGAAERPEVGRGAQAGVRLRDGAKPGVRLGGGPESRVKLEVVRDAEVVTDPRRVERILANLVTNALHHGAPPVTVTVDGPVISVADHGPGFQPALLDRLREHGPQRFESGATARGTGVGLGLTIAAGQARLLGATLEFANTGEGAIVVLRLPGSSSHHR